MKSPLGIHTPYPSHYDPSLLHPIDRALARAAIAINNAELPFSGVDIWNAYELSWLSESGKPEVAVGKFIFPANSPAMVESKSFKLYLNSINQTKFDSLANVQQTLANDLSAACGITVGVELEKLTAVAGEFHDFDGICVDEIELTEPVYEYDNRYLTLAVEKHHAHENLYSHLLKTNCPVTGQPDWASVIIRYQGRALDHAGLLRYLVSFRNHNDFHEHCVEKIYTDILHCCGPESLTVAAFYTRRGGLDINPIRTTGENFDDLLGVRSVRQ